jgi:osmotically-inducible protein OsmY
VGTWGTLLFLIAVDGPELDGQWQPVRTQPGSAKPADRRTMPSTKLRDEATVEDWLLETEARGALWWEPSLDDLVLQVVVQNGVATLFGSVPTEELGRRAAEIVRSVKGIREVHSRFRLRAPPAITEPRPRMFPPVDQPFRMNQPEPPADGVKPDTSMALPGVLMGRPQHEPSLGNELGAWRPRESLKPMPLSPAPAIEHESPIQFSLRRLLQSNPRFRDTSFSIQGGEVRLRGKVAGMSDLIDLIQAVSQVDGVKRVLTDEVQVGK